MLMRSWFALFGRLLQAIVGLALLASCASDPRYQQGLEWVLSAEAERKRLNDAGFPQYNRE